MARFRRRMALRPINSNKNIVDASGAMVANTNVIQAVIVGTEDWTGVVNTVPVSAHVSSFYLYIKMLAGADQISSSDLYVWCKRNVQSVSSDFPNPGSTGGSEFRNQIIHEQKAILTNQDSGDAMVFEGVIRIPKIYQRIRDGDEIGVSLRQPSAGHFCIKAIYKFYR